MNPDRITKSIGSVLAATALFGLTVTPLASAATNQTHDPSDIVKIKKEIANIAKVSKSETVYVFGDANGNVDHIQVSSKLSNPHHLDVIHDKANLSGIENTESKAAYSTEGGQLLWDAKGEDIYYKGMSDAEPPVSLKVSYKLDGKEISPDDLAGKSGKVTIRFDYKNNSYDKAQGVYTPFLCASAMMLDNDSFKNIKVTNGKLVDDGDRNLIIGYALPGLSESVNLSQLGELDIADYFQVTADATDFKLDGTYTVVSSALFDEVDENDLSTGGLGGSMDQMQNAMNKIVNGADDLSDALGLFAAIGDMLPDAVNTANNGMQALSTGLGDAVVGAGQIEDGLGQLLSGPEYDDDLNDAVNGTALLAQGLKGAVEGTSSTQIGLNGIAAGIGQVSAGLKAAASTETAQALAGAVATVDSNANTAVEKAQSIAGSAQSLAGSASTLAQLAEGLASQAQNMAANASNAGSNVDSALAALNSMDTEGMTDQQKEALAQAIGNLETASAQASAVAGTAANAAANAGSAAQEAGAAAGTIGGMAQDVKDLATAAAYVSGASNGISQSLGALDFSQATNALDQLQGGLTQYGYALAGENNPESAVSQLLHTSSKLQEAVDGVEQLKDGVTQLKGDVEEESGLSYAEAATIQLAAATQALADGSPALVDALNQLDDGSSALAKGVKQFNEEAIQKLVSTFGEIEGSVGSLQSVIRAGKGYETFSGLGDNMDGKVSFIYKTAAIK